MRSSGYVSRCLYLDLILYMPCLMFSIQNVVMTSELLDDHRDTLKGKEGTIAELR